MLTSRMCVVAALLAITPTVIAQVPSSSLIVNGDFSAGNTGFTSSYTYNNPALTGSNTVFDQGVYTIAPSLMHPTPIHPSPGLPDYYDHTVGDVTGNFMVLNGSTTANKAFYTTSVNVEPNSFYNFSMWLSVWNNSSNNLPQIQVSFNGAVAMIAVPPVPLGTWTNFTTSWFSGENTTVKIELQDNVLDFGGNDFGLDDVSFSLRAAAVPEPGTIALLSVVLLGAGGYRVIQKRRASKALAAR